MDYIHQGNYEAAFPLAGERHLIRQPGMDIRTWLAGQIAPVCLNLLGTQEQRAKMAVDFTDAIIKELNRTNK
jgi:hypothetical protein